MVTRKIVKKEIKDVPNKMLDTSRSVYECLVCGNRVISNIKPVTCSCSHNGNYVINTTLLVTK